MRRANRQLLWMLVTVALLAGLVLWTVQRRSADARPETLLPFAADTVSRIDIKTRKGERRRFEKRDGHWYMLAPQKGRADAGHMQRLSAIARARILDWRPAREFDPKKIGLAPPWAVVTIDGHELKFGTLSALAPQRYVLVHGHIAMIPARYGADIAATADSELAHAGSTLPKL
ncbi:MAG: hypothetical protein WCD66_03775 [Rhodanobacteraceae bacterium]